MIPLPEYPRPQLRREEASFTNLNGLWEYAILEGGLPEGERPQVPPMQGHILVPYSPETARSGVGYQLLKHQVLWYERRVAKEELPKRPKAGRLLLHFGAVDQVCKVFVNGHLAGENQGGYFPFTLDVTAFSGDDGLLIQLAVKDQNGPCEAAWGKQRNKPGGIWYHGQSGIWQTVWLEAVPREYIQEVVIIPDLAGGRVSLRVKALGEGQLTGEVYAPNAAGQTTGGEEIARFEIQQDGSLMAQISSPRPWSPEDPYLYTYRLRFLEDEVWGYFALRSFGIKKDREGTPRLTLNGKPTTQVGVLDQGYWQGGGYTPPSDAAMAQDILRMKALGFNMLRKHIKLEPLRWYHHCDRLGMLVWQDVVSGGGPYRPWMVQVLPILNLHLSDRRPGRFGRKSQQSREIYFEELRRTIRHLISVPSLALWVPFNEGWGQFEALRAAQLTKQLDPTRPVDHASGWHDQGGPDLKSRHIYFSRCSIKQDKKGRPAALTEYGGFSYAVPGHEPPGKPFGYRRFDSLNGYQQAVLRLMDGLLVHGRNIAAFVYTQLSDVEQEVNGLLTEDRAVSKWPEGSPAAQALLERNLALRALGRE